MRHNPLATIRNTDRALHVLKECYAYDKEDIETFLAETLQFTELQPITIGDLISGLISCGEVEPDSGSIAAEIDSIIIEFMDLD